MGDDRPADCVAQGPARGATSARPRPGGASPADRVGTQRGGSQPILNLVFEKPLPDMPETESVARSLERYVSILRRQWWVMVIVVIVALAAAAFYVSNATPVYSASSKVVVGQDQTLFNPAVSVNYQAFTSTISSLLQSNVVAQDTIKKLGLKMTPTQLLSNLSV